jgi:hypothetical protein
MVTGTDNDKEAMKPMVIITKGINTATGRESKDTAFTEQNWGQVTRGYLASIQKMSTDAFDEVVELARGGHLDDEDEEAERAALVEYV